MKPLFYSMASQVNYEIFCFLFYKKLNNEAKNWLSFISFFSLHLQGEQSNTLDLLTLKFKRKRRKEEQQCQF
jgi:hypothetical protein